MAYGALITNANDSTIVGAGEQTYLYWGKITQTVGGTTTYGASPTYSLFNLPSSYDVVLYAYCVGDEQAFIIKYEDAGKWRARAYVRGSTNNTVMHLYVFVQAKYIPLPNYGVVLYDDSSNIQWHSGRPSLGFNGYRFDDSANVLVPQPISGYQPIVQVGTSHGSSMIITSPDGPNASYDGFIWCIYAQRTVGGIKQHGLRAQRISSVDSGWFKGEYYSQNESDLPIAYTFADAGFYDGFPSLGNA